MLLLVREDAEWASLSPSEQDYASIGRWWAQLAQQGVLRDGRELKSSRTATTVRWEGPKPMVTDGPFMEARDDWRLWRHRRARSRRRYRDRTVVASPRPQGLDQTRRAAPAVSFE